MKVIDQLENKVADWLKPLPHLPTNVTKWISTNLWWITLVGVIASVIGVIVLIITMFTAISLIGATSSFYGYYYVTSSYNWWSVVVLIVSILFMIATIVLTAMAVNPLKKMDKKGWSILFLLEVASAAYMIINAVISLNFLGLISGAIGVAIGAYLLYEIRSYFITVAKAVPAK